MKNYDLGHEIPDYGAEALEPSGRHHPTRTVYPEIHLRGDDLPSFPDGEFMAMVKVKKTGSRDPIDEGEEKSCDLAVLELGLISPEKARGLATEGDHGSGHTETKAPRRSLAQSVSVAKEGY